MKRKRLPKSIRKFIRKEKARIRREVLGIKEQEDRIEKLYQRFLRKNNKDKKEVKNSKIDSKNKEIKLTAVK